MVIGAAPWQGGNRGRRRHLIHDKGFTSELKIQSANWRIGRRMAPAGDQAIAVQCTSCRRAARAS